MASVDRPGKNLPGGRVDFLEKEQWVPWKLVGILINRVQPNPGHGFVFCTRRVHRGDVGSNIGEGGVVLYCVDQTFYYRDKETLPPPFFKIRLPGPISLEFPPGKKKKNQTVITSVARIPSCSSELVS